MRSHTPYICAVISFWCGSCLIRGMGKRPRPRPSYPLMIGLPEDPRTLRGVCVRGRETETAKGIGSKAKTATGAGRQKGSGEGGGPARALDRGRFLSLTVLTLCVFAFAGDPEIQQGCTLLQQGVGVFHTDPVDVFHAELKLPSQLCRQRSKTGCEPASGPPAGAVPCVWQGVPGIKEQCPLGFGIPSYQKATRGTQTPTSSDIQKIGQG